MYLVDVDGLRLPKMSLQEVIGKEWDSFEKKAIALTKEKKGSNIATSGTSDDKLVATDEQITMLWLNEIFKDIDFHGKEWQVHADNLVSIFKEKLRPYFMNSNFRLDLWLGVTAKQFPVFVTEILSKSDLDLTVGECERRLCDVLRLYRNYNTACKELCAFVLPASVKIDATMNDKARMVQQK